MSKTTIIRKKALDLVRQQDWQGAIKEYRRLVEMDQSNPNIHNELADLYLRTGSKTEAYDSFVRAIDEYTRVGLYNNAVAVAKKVMRVLPSRVEVLASLAGVRMKQGLAREAESYYVSFLEKAAGGSVSAATFKKITNEVMESLSESVPVLQKLSGCLLASKLDDEAGEVLIQLHRLLEKSGNAAAAAEVRASIERLGAAARLDAARKGVQPEPGRTVVTEANIWTESHSAGERIDIESTPRFTPPSASPPAQSEPRAPGAAPAPGASSPPEPAPGSNGPSERELYLLRLARGVGQTPMPRADRSAQEKAVKPAAGPAPSRTEEPPVEPAKTPEPAATATLTPRPAPAAGGPSASKAGDPTQISALIDDDSAGGQGEEDYRSHYDLGMAYMEMELLPEAIREYQAASRSPQYQVKCLEMIGLCFVRQNQPQLAIKQLSRGLALIDPDSEESLGMKYNLGLAYEMAGDFAAALAQFEDVYVVDVTFRDVAEKVRALANKS